MRIDCYFCYHEYSSVLLYITEARVRQSNDFTLRGKTFNSWMHWKQIYIYVFLRANLRVERFQNNLLSSWCLSFPSSTSDMLIWKPRREIFEIQYALLKWKIIFHPSIFCNKFREYEINLKIDVLLTSPKVLRYKEKSIIFLMMWIFTSLKIIQFFML